jgi:quinol monooxygenase YgiN
MKPGETLVSGYEVIEHLHQSNHYDVYEAWSEESLPLHRQSLAAG